MADDFRFYVYEHWRSDTNECFYVGKGHGKRAFQMRGRKNHHQHVVAKLERIGQQVEVRIVRDGMRETDALAFEVERIAHWRFLGAKLANVTDGGEGVSGLKHSDATRALLSERLAGKKRGPCPPERKEKIAAAQRGRLKGPNPEHSARLKGRKHDPEVVARRAASLRGRSCPENVREIVRNRYLGKQLDDQHRANLSAAHVGKKPSVETREKMRLAQIARWARTVDRTVSEETRAKISASKRAAHAAAKLARG